MSKRKFVKLAIDHLYRSYVLPARVSLSFQKTAILSSELYASKETISRCVLLCHYNSNGLLLEQVKFIASFFQNQGIDVIVVTTKVNESAKNWIQSNLSGLIIRRNIGRDFGAWKDSIAWLRQIDVFNNLKELYLLNDSVIIISSSLGESRLQTDLIDNQKSDLIGLTESWQGGYHLQSYFLKFNQSALQSEIFLKFWQSYALVNSRTYSINYGEIGLSHYFIKNGFVLKCLYPFSELHSVNTWAKLMESIKSNLTGLSEDALSEYVISIRNEIFCHDFTETNCTHRLWTLLAFVGCPFLKRDLMEKNPEGLQSVKHFFEFLDYFCLPLPIFFNQTLANLSIPRKDSLGYYLEQLLKG